MDNAKNVDAQVDKPVDAQIDERVDEICRELNISVRRGQKLSNHTALGVGGEIRAIAYPEFRENAAKFVAELERLKVRWLPLGSGSRLVARDQFIDAVAINLKLIEELLTFRENRVHAHGGYRVSRIVTAAAERGLAGLERFHALSGSIAAAIRNDERARGVRLNDLLERVAIARNGVVIELTKDEMKSYRGELILGCVLKLEVGDAAQLKQMLKRAADKARQPDDRIIRGTGPVFRNIKGRSPRALISRLGLNGLSCGDAAISPIDGNYIVNNGAASAEDVMSLIEMVQRKVALETGIKLRSALEVW